MTPPSKLAFVGDVHLEQGDPLLPEFLRLLEHLGRSAGRLVLIGDLFNIWIGRRELEQPHHRAVVDKLAELRAAGVVVRYLEGNRDYRIGGCYTGEAVDESTEGGIVERVGGRSIFAIHGDCANPDDWQYLSWRKLSRSGIAWGLFNLIPKTARARLAEQLEGRFRGTNLEFKREFPEQQVRRYAAGFLEQGHDIVVLGHFHVERELDAGAGRIFVLPEWKGSRRHLEIDVDGVARFVDFG